MTASTTFIVIGNHSVDGVKPGDEIKGLDPDRAARLIARGSVKVKAGTPSRPTPSAGDITDRR
jgi:hypothetical protein